MKKSFWKKAAVLAAAVMMALTVPAVAEEKAIVGNSIQTYVYTVRVQSGYLALRNAMAYDSSNEIGKLYTGETVQAIDRSGSQYWYVYAPTLGKFGFVNKDYLFDGSVTNTNFTMEVKVASGYLALRNAMAYDVSNEIGKLYTGDRVTVTDWSAAQYWYVYAPTLGKYGYVNKDYLINPSSTLTSQIMRVQVSSGYLALRTQKAYDDSNIIGELYTGDTVQVTDWSDGQYWYVYAPTLGKYGYVNKDYLVKINNINPSFTRTVYVQKGYLALRSAKYYDVSNEIGELYTGAVVTVMDTSDSTYWYVYAPTLGKYGYVNKDYLY